MKIIRLSAILVVLVMPLLLALPTPVFAIADPDSPSQIDQVLVFEDLLETGDTGVLINYYIDYAALPPETATTAYFAVFVDTDGVTQLKTSAPYTYVANALKGYRQGLVWIYFTASETISLGLDSLQVANYDIWVAGNPTLVWVVGPDPPKTVGAIDSWFTSGDPAVLLAQRVLGFAQTLGLAWTMTLIEQTALGNRLTAAGETYFTNVIPNLRQMAPAAFSSAEYDPIMEDLDYATSFGATMTNGAGVLGGTVTGSPIVFTDLTTPGTADAGTATTLDDAILTQADSYWNGARLTITDTTDGLAPKDEVAIITGFTAVNDRLTFAALTAAVDTGDTYILHTGGHGTADAGTVTTLDDLTLIQGDDYWNGARLVIVTTTDGLAPEGETALITDFVASVELPVPAIARLTFGALTAAVDEGDTYVLGFTVVDVTVAGTFTMQLTKGTIGTFVDNTGTVTGSPVSLVAGTGAIIVTGIGNFTAVLYMVNTQTSITDTIIGTGFDLTVPAARFGMTRLMFSGLVWFVMAVVICASVYKTTERLGTPGGGGKAVMLTFMLCIIGGIVIGFVSVLVGALLFIAFGTFIGYILFLKQAHI